MSMILDSIKNGNKPTAHAPTNNAANIGFQIKSAGASVVDFFGTNDSTLEAWESIVRLETTAAGSDYITRICAFERIKYVVVSGVADVFVNGV